MSQFKQTISNNYLGLKKDIRANSALELKYKVQQQRAQWKKREEKERRNAFLNDMKLRAEALTRDTIMIIEEHRNILQYTINNPISFEWEQLYSKGTFNETAPELDDYIKKLEVPHEDKLWEFFLPSRKANRLSLIKKAQREYDMELNYHKNRHDSFNSELERKNRVVDTFKQNVTAGVCSAIEEYLRLVLIQSPHPTTNSKEFNLSYDTTGKIVVVDYWLPSPTQVPKAKQYKYVKATNSITSSEMSKKEFEAFYENVLYQIALRTVYEVFQAISGNHIETVVFNGLVEEVDAATGNDFQSCIISLQVKREEFETIKLSRVDVKACFRKLKGLSAGPLHNLAPVAPIMQLNKEDSRFVESRDVLAEMNSIPNLAAMEWEDFEHLTGQLFEKMFKARGADVRITRKSRDHGIDAVVFDEDPIFGGKILIQAKRYNNIVTPAAVRELWGSVNDERASKGILVTTGWFGPDSLEFAKDKPITLIAGEQLLHLLMEHGYHARLEYQNKL